MAGAAGEVVILLRAVLGSAAFGLERDERTALVDRDESEIFGGVAPGFLKVLSQGFGEFRECLAILGERPVDP